jgi:hypothetical protein
MRLRNKGFILSCIGLLAFTFSCKIYNFTGGSIPPEVKTISVGFIENQAGSGPPSLPLVTTEKIKTYFQDNSSLSIAPTNGDWQITGYISQYSTEPVAPQAGQTQTAALTRLRITVVIDFHNTLASEEEDEVQDERHVKDFKLPFSYYADFTQDQSLSQVENELINQILDQIVLDIYTKTTSNW